MTAPPPPLNSASKEIALHRGDVPEHRWLVGNGFLRTDSVPYNIAPINDWSRPGAESCVMDFEVVTQDTRVHAIAKTCVKSAPVEVINSWMMRRKRLKFFGVSVPRLYSRQDTSYIEEYIDYDLKTAFTDATDHGRKKLVDQFVAMHQSIAQAGFMPISLHDIRSRGDDVVIIDYGSDLGGWRDDQAIAVTNESSAVIMSKIVGQRL